jgi:hypothetical protein
MSEVIFFHEINVKKDIFSNIKTKFFKMEVQFINLDPDPATQTNVDPCGSTFTVSRRGLIH